MCLFSFIKCSLNGKMYVNFHSPLFSESAGYII